MQDDFHPHPTISRDQTSKAAEADDFSILLARGQGSAESPVLVAQKSSKPESPPFLRQPSSASIADQLASDDDVVEVPRDSHSDRQRASVLRSRPRANAISGGRPTGLGLGIEFGPSIEEEFDSSERVDRSVLRNFGPFHENLDSRQLDGIFPAATVTHRRKTEAAPQSMVDYQSSSEPEAPSPAVSGTWREGTVGVGTSHAPVNAPKRTWRHVRHTSERPSKRQNIYVGLAEPILVDEPSEAPGQSTGESVSRKELDKQIFDLESQIKKLQGLKRQHVPQEWRVIYRVYENRKVDSSEETRRMVNLYLDQPRWYGGIEGHEPLAGTEPILDLKSYLERHSELAFVVFRDYGRKRPDGSHFSSIGEAHHRAVEEGFPLPCGESTAFVYKEMHNTIETFRQSLPDNHGIVVPPDKSWPQEMQAPYLLVYHHRERFFNLINSLQGRVRKPWLMFADYISQGFGPEYSEVDLQFQQGLVCPRFFKYLIQPGDVLHYPHHRTVEAVQAVSALSKAQTPRNGFGVPLQESRGIEIESGINVHYAGTQQRMLPRLSWTIDVTFWSFSITFKREREEVRLEMTAEVDEAVPISSLPFYPFHFASEDVKKRIATSGANFWKFRIRGYVEYSKNEGIHAWSSIKSRYMIDPVTYRLMHRAIQNDSVPSAPGDLSPEEFQQQECPAYPFPVLLPKVVQGYNFTEKKWVDLEVDYIRDVEWNTKAFENLVTGTETKDLLEALVKNQLKLETSTDLITGKGNGLIILLHGGPGTGKTYTAESVADYARKPLYRVTCGDIGTKPVEVERYLETVLRLGRIWGCVVLLDEADIFLEERTLSDLDRNALVSVFLRVLEYYDGILILTSNRVGHFDEAFRSRIQLALHYESLDQEQRHSIWANFIKHLYNSGSCNMDFADLQLNINNLSKEEMNGRQIRNAITTARQYAEFKDKPLNYEVIKKVITVAGRFDRYLHDVKKARKVKDGTDDDKIARDAGAR